MPTRLIALWALAAIALVAPLPAAAAPQWAVQADESRLEFLAIQSGSPVRGVFAAFEAEIRFDPDDLAGSAVAVTIDMASVDTRARDRDDTLRGRALFDVAQHPQARFEARAFERSGPEDFSARGTLTLRGVTRDILLPFELTIAGDGPGAIARASGEVVIDRLDYGVGQGQWADTSIIADEVRIEFEITAVSKAP